ncbi:MAG: lipopolysaccharide heptosyltransferase II [Syntrophales bacterium]|jgi:heptosyltransferase-2|nr:lipopolysaccharide heptosyltransferase II [Syntrophales bacterium]MDY0044517.1 lipopolysaccharide heptosyltransferase II [Syntrophales bacterium]
MNRDALLSAKNIIIRGTNWIGDVIMSLPAVSAIKGACPDARIAVLAKPWVADIYRLSPDVDEVIVFQSPGRHSGIHGKWRLARELRTHRFDAAILLQNAIEAAIIAVLAGIPVRAGYNTDGRGLLLTHSVKRRKGIQHLHQTQYYLEMVRACGFHFNPTEPVLSPAKEDLLKANRILDDVKIEKGEIIVGMAPGAAYGPAKMWYPDRYAALADMLIERKSSRVFLFGSASDKIQTETVKMHARNDLINLAGKTTLAEAIALMSRCDLFITNDSGLMHIAGALGIPLVAIFGSTNPETTSPAGERSVIIYKKVECSPCLKKSCPGDFRCMDLVCTEDVYECIEKMQLRR